ncbi:MAG: hypothetical protein ACFCUN_14045 [Hyphomicrobiaceae bacterium]
MRDEARAHVPRVRPGPDGAGQGGERCLICHRDSNDTVTRIPGAPGWRMPPWIMSWDGLDAVDICANITNPDVNGGRSLEALAAHIEHDHLIAWAFAPGAGRTPPPMDYETFKARVRAWIAGGASCPE